MFPPASAFVLAFAGVILIELSLYFTFLRSSLLPEDTQIVGTSLAQV